ncbi:hypothetical protein J6S88_02445 [bacterium]|nr:hypothetical protein [bacterium]
MMYNEFCEMLGDGWTVSMDDYKKIEFVYTWSKLIPDFLGKKKIVELFKVGGMELIENLIPAAKIDQQIELEENYIANIQTKVEKYQKIATELDELSENSDVYWEKASELLDKELDEMEKLEDLRYWFVII